MPLDRPQLIARTALQVLASAGSRGLTHRAVDSAAGLPPGSTSYYFRTRGALLEGCVGALLEQSMDDLTAMERVMEAEGPAAMAIALADTLHGWLTTHRDRQLARFELSLEAVRRPELARVLALGGATIRARVADALRATGSQEPAERANLLVACVDGVLFDRIAGARAGTEIDRAELGRQATALTELALGRDDPRRTGSARRTEGG